MSRLIIIIISLVLFQNTFANEKALKFANFTHNIKKNTCIAALYAVKYHRFRTDTL